MTNRANDGSVAEQLLLARPKRRRIGGGTALYPGIVTVGKTLADGSRALYRYYRPTMTRLYAAPGSLAFTAEYAEVVTPRRRKRGASDRPAPLSEPRPTNVYFIASGLTGLIKIGRARDVARRLTVLQTGSADKLELLLVLADDAGLLEKRLHKVLRPARSHGEWFHPTPALLAFIEDAKMEPLNVHD